MKFFLELKYLQKILNSNCGVLPHQKFFSALCALERRQKPRLCECFGNFWWCISWLWLRICWNRSGASRVFCWSLNSELGTNFWELPILDRITLLKGIHDWWLETSFRLWSEIHDPHQNETDSQITIYRCFSQKLGIRSTWTKKFKFSYILISPAVLEPTNNWASLLYSLIQ